MALMNSNVYVVHHLYLINHLKSALTEPFMLFFQICWFCCF